MSVLCIITERLPFTTPPVFATIPSMKNWIHFHWLRVLAIVLVLGALASFPFVYYQLMNWVVVVAALVTAYQAHQHKLEFVMWLFVALAIIFNPLAPLYLRQDVWRVADIIAAMFFVVACYVLPLPSR